MARDVRPPACAGSLDWERHCLHYPAGFSPEFDPAPWDLTCCDCGLEWTIDSFNRRAGTHGPHRTGEAMARRQMRFGAPIRVLPPLPKREA